MDTLVCADLFCGYGGSAMGINWVYNKKDLAQMIPPLFSEYLGRQVIEYLNEI